MATVPTNPVVINLADLAGYFQFKKDNGHDMTAEPIVVRETGQLCVVEDVGGTIHICGPEYVIPIQVVTPAALTANSIFCYFNVPPDTAILLTSLVILSNTDTTLDETHYWTFGVSAKTEVNTIDTPVTVDNSLGTAGSDYVSTITEFTTNPLQIGAYYVLVSATKTSTPGAVTLNAVLRGRNIIATLT